MDYNELVWGCQDVVWMDFGLECDCGLIMG